MAFIPDKVTFELYLDQFYNESVNCSAETTKWSWQTSESSLINQVYLKSTTSYYPINTATDHYNHINEEIQDESDIVQEENDESVMISNVYSTENSSQVTIIQLEHHIVYSASYRVPVLYFKANYQNGTPLTIEEIYQKLVLVTYKQQDVIISQNEHPVLGTPFWYIHPCDTSKLMSTIHFTPIHYIKTWLSFQGPIVKCQISKDLFRVPINV